MKNKLKKKKGSHTKPSIFLKRKRTKKITNFKKAREMREKNKN